MVILAAAYFAIFSTENMLKGYTPGNLIFWQDLNITIKNNSIWGLIQYWKQAKIQIYNTRKNIK